MSCCEPADVGSGADKISDSTGASLSGGALLARALVLDRLLARHVLKPLEASTAPPDASPEDRTPPGAIVGVLLPPSVPAVVVNAALVLARAWR